MIRRSLRTISGETAAGLTLGVTVFCMVLGSASMHGVVGPGRKLRWAALLALVAVALVVVLRDRRRAPAFGVPLRRALLLGAWFVAVAAVSATWSVDSRLTLGRAGSLGLVFIAAAALAFVARTRPLLPVRLLQGILVGATAAAAGGLVALAFFHDTAVQAATVQSPARFQGLGQNPDTVSMLCGLAFSIGVWAFVRARSLPARLLSGGSLVLFAGTIAASGSRGAILAALAGGTLFALAHPARIRQRLSIALAVIVAMTGVTAATRIPKPLPYTAATQPVGTKSSGTQLPPPGTPVGTNERQYDGRLADELYRYQPGPRSLLQSSGRLQAWRQAIDQADARPALGYGFGTENKVFINRSSNFNGTYAENSFIGLYLQLGAIGLASFVALLVAVGVAAVGAVRSAAVEAPAPALAAVFTSGLALMLIQSYAYSAGNIVTVAFWVCGFTAASLAPVRVVTEATETRKAGAVAPA